MTIIGYSLATWMGADPTVLLRLCTALIRSRVDYGGLLFDSLTDGQIDLLEKIECKAFRLAFGYMRTSRKNIMLAEAKIPLITF
jgi:hypothetical protein